jgi:hypothetical protein
MFGNVLICLQARSYYVSVLPAFDTSELFQASCFCFDKGVSASLAGRYKQVKLIKIG